jgi:D-glycero-D-manno-heptose 1,7-bisphosphate phosphatase
MGILSPVTKRGVFLDRDGVINRAIIRNGKPYPPADLSEFEILPGVPQALARLKSEGFSLIIVTNQPDVARGKAAPATLERFHELIRAQLPVDDIFSCVHDDADNCACRKPKPGMLFEARDRFGLSLESSFLVGDRWRDVETGRNAGCRTIFIDYGYAEQRPLQPADHVCSDLCEAADWIIANFHHSHDRNP